MKYLLLSSCLILLSGWLISPCNGQMDGGRLSCLLINFSDNAESANPDNIIDTCERFYDDGDYYFSGSPLSNFTQVFSRIHGAFIKETDNQCVELMENYLCHYYFPLCNQENNEIIPVCSRSCVSLRNNEDCHDLKMIANEELERVNITSPDDTCINHRSYIDLEAVTLSTSCYSIEGGQAVYYHDNNTTLDFDESVDVDGGSFTVGAIVGLVLGVLFVVTIVIIILVLFARRKKWKRAVKDNTSAERARCITHANTGPSPELMHQRKNGNSVLNHFLDDVKNRFSEVLLPVDSVTKHQSLLGKGAFGLVHKGEMVSSGGIVTAVAIKTIKFSSLDAMKDLVAESSIMKTFHHPNVLPLLGVCIDYDDEDVLKIVIPFMTNGDLKNFLKGSRISPNNTHEYPKNLSEEMLMKMCLDIAKGMEYLAQKRFIHRDLAARNCMVDTLHTIKIADFGLAKDVYSTEYYRVEKHTTLPVKWMAIESLLDGYFDEKTDVWSYGITCWEIFSLGRIPYPGVDNVNVTTLLKSGTRLRQPELCPTKMNELIASTWLENSDDRPTFTVIVQKLSGICM